MPPDVFVAIFDRGDRKDEDRDEGKEDDKSEGYGGEKNWRMAMANRKLERAGSCAEVALRMHVGTSHATKP